MGEKTFIESYVEGLERIRNAVIILPDDAEPVEGDIIQHCGGDLIYKVTDYIAATSYFGIEEAVSKMRYEANWKIIQRGGKPVIYESALKAAKGTGG